MLKAQRDDTGAVGIQRVSFFIDIPRLIDIKPVRQAGPGAIQNDRPVTRVTTGLAMAWRPQAMAKFKLNTLKADGLDQNPGSGYEVRNGGRARGRGLRLRTIGKHQRLVLHRCWRLRRAGDQGARQLRHQSPQCISWLAWTGRDGLLARRQQQGPHRVDQLWWLELMLAGLSHRSIQSWHFSQPLAPVRP